MRFDDAEGITSRSACISKGSINIGLRLDSERVEAFAMNGKSHSLDWLISGQPYSNRVCSDSLGSVFDGDRDRI